MQRRRFQCKPCLVAWTGKPDDVSCWNCGEAGSLGPLPSVYRPVAERRSEAA